MKNYHNKNNIQLKYLTLALDTMGGDFGPIVTIPASLKALSLYPYLKLLLVGNPDKISPYLLKENSLFHDRLTVIPSRSVIGGDVKPSHAIRISRDTSMRVALELIKSGQAQACVSAGNTGALMGLSKLVLKPIKGIERPALTILLPNQKKGKTVILDLGANILCSDSMLVQFAIMGSVISEQILGVTNPKVALLNIGEEEIKGIESIRQASAVLRTISSIHYIGYLEADDLLTGKTDVLICDGFIGNITLKTMEGVIRVLLSLLSSSKKKDRLSWPIQKINFWIKRRLINKFDQLLNPDQYNGACLIGLTGIVIKSHGAANQRAFTSAIEQAMYAVKYKVSEKISSQLNTIFSKNKN